MATDEKGKGTMLDTGLKDKAAVVTGANHGIGAATAKALAAEGAKVFVTYLRIPQEDDAISHNEAEGMAAAGRARIRAIRAKSADEVLQSIRDNGGQAEAWEADLGDPDNIPRIFDHAEAAFGPVQVLVNNATYCGPVGTIFTTSAELFDRYFAVNTRATVLMMRQFALRHRERGGTWGRIVNLSQDCAQTAGDHIAYSSTKATIEMLTRSAVWRLGPLGITVNCVAPGPVQTGYISPENEKREIAGLPMGRIGQPEDLAKAIVFLASDLAGWITGQVIKVDGGHGYGLK